MFDFFPGVTYGTTWMDINTIGSSMSLQDQTPNIYTQGNILDQTEWNKEEYYQFLRKNFTFNSLLVIAFSACVIATLGFVFCKLYYRMEALRTYWTKEPKLQGFQWKFETV